MKSAHFSFVECVVVTVGGFTSLVPAGKHLVVEVSSANGGVSIRPAGKDIHISADEWLRLQSEKLVSE